MKCDKAQEFFSDYIETTLDRPMVVALETHLNGCEACRADVSSLRDMWTVLDKVPPVEPPADFVWRTTTRLQNEVLNRREAERARPLPWWKRMTPVQAFSYAGIAALIIVGLAIPARTAINVLVMGVGRGNVQVIMPPPPVLRVTPPQFTAQAPGLNGAAATVTIQATSDMPYAAVAMAYLTPDGQRLVGRATHVGVPRTLAAGQSLAVAVQDGRPMAAHAAKISVYSNRQTFEKVVIWPGAPAAAGPMRNADAYFALLQVANRTGEAMLVDAGLTALVTLDLQSVTTQQALQSVLAQVGARSAPEATGVIDITK
jgi:hypothetical protein